MTGRVSPCDKGTTICCSNTESQKSASDDNIDQALCLANKTATFEISI
jgi:hypothetical protein